MSRRFAGCVLALTTGLTGVTSAANPQAVWTVLDIAAHLDNAGRVHVVEMHEEVTLPSAASIGAMFAGQTRPLPYPEDEEWAAGFSF